MTYVGTLDPEAVANDLLTRSNQCSPPVDLQSVIALWPGLRVSEDDLERDGYLIDLGSLGGEIIVRSSDAQSRQTFTAAHELGHWILRLKVPDVRGLKASKQVPELETWCHEFAANLLMPRQWVLNDLRSGGRTGLHEVVKNMPDKYQVSHEAFRRRVSQITPISLFILRYTNGMMHEERSYVSTQVQKECLLRSLNDIKVFLMCPHPPQEYTHADTHLVSLHSLVTRSTSVRKWLVSLMPMRKSIGE